MWRRGSGLQVRPDGHVPQHPTAAGVPRRHRRGHGRERARAHDPEVPGWCCPLGHFEAIGYRTVRSACSPDICARWRRRSWPSCPRLRATGRSSSARPATASTRGPALADNWAAERPARRLAEDGRAGAERTGGGRGRVILFHRVGNREVVEAIDARDRRRRSGATAIRRPIATTSDSTKGRAPCPWWPTASSTPSARKGSCMRSISRQRDGLWSEDTMRRFSVPKDFFGAAGSPLVEDGRVIANIGGKDAGIVAFDAKTGKVQWTATDDEASYSSAVGATFGGRRVAMFLTRNGLVGLEPATGRVQFQQPWRSRSAASVNAATPLVIGDLMFISAEYGPGRRRLSDRRRRRSTQLWASDDALSNHYATSVHRDGMLYGFHGRQEFGPSLRAVELRTGKVRWSGRQFRAGSVTLAGDRLLIVRETGELMLAAASPDAFRPLARAQVLPATVRAFPAIADGFVYVRNDNTLMCLDLRR